MKKLLFIISVCLCLAATAQPRFTDSTFGINGKIVQNSSLPRQRILDMVLQPDGKPVVLAYAAYNRANRIAIVRFTTSGTPDTSFSSDGIADSLIFPTGEMVYSPSIKMQLDGKLLVCGYTSNTSSRGFVLRYTNNGNLDASFGTNGILRLPYSTTSPITARSRFLRDIVVLPSNKLMLIADISRDTTGIELIQLNDNGTTDSSFGTNGSAWIINRTTFFANNVKACLQTDGKLVIAGNTSSYSSNGTNDLLLLRIKTNGTLDSTYGINGKLAFNSGSGSITSFTDIAMQTDGKVVLSGVTKGNYDQYQYTYVARTTTSGTLDASFGTNGRLQLTKAITSGFISIEGQISLQQDGKILLAGCTTNTAGFGMTALLRLTTGGTLDIGFDGDGIAALQANEHASFGMAPVQQPDGKILLAGFINNNSAASVALMRLTTTGQMDNAFSPTTTIAYTGAGYDDEKGLGVLLQPADQKVLDIKQRFNGVKYDLRVSRYLRNGSPDSSYGTNGQAIIEMFDRSMVVHSNLLSNGKLLMVCYNFDYLKNYRIQLIQLTASGMPDSSYSINGRQEIDLALTGTYLAALDDVAFQQDGKVLLLVSKYNPSPYADSTFLLRINADGSPDTSFSSTGKKYMPSPGGYLGTGDYVHIALQKDGKILLANNEANYSGGGSYKIVLSRLNTNGSTDNTYSFTAPLLFHDVSRMAVQPDNKVVLYNYPANVYRVGSNGKMDSTFGTAGKVDVAVYYLRHQLWGDIQVLDSGKLILTGSKIAYTNDTSYSRIVKLKNNGRPDSSFGENGLIQVDAITALVDGTPILARQADGGMLLTGAASDGITTYGMNAVLTRLTTNNPPTTGRTYVFTGSGLWSNGANWADGTVPPTTIPTGSSLVIDPPATGECVIDIAVRVQPGASVTIKAGKKVRLPSNLIIQ